MANIQTAEEKELIAKWNAGEYSAQGWVNNTDGLTQEALRGLAEYNTKKYLDDKSSAIKDSDLSASASLLGLSDDTTTAFVTMRVISVLTPFGVLTAAGVPHDFGSGFNYFVSLFMGQGGAGYGFVTGQATYVASEVGRGNNSTVLKKEPETNKIVLKSDGSKFCFSGSAGSLNIDKEYTGVGFYLV